MNANKYYIFENNVEKIFTECGYSVNHIISCKDINYDIVAKKNGKSFCVEVKYSQITENAVMQTYVSAKLSDLIPVLVTAYCIDEQKRNYYKSKYPDVELIDISNLLFAVQYDTKLRNELIAVLPYSVNDIEPKEGFIKSDFLKHSDYTDSLIKEMQLCQSGKEMSKTYEKLCYDLLMNIFSDDLALWNEQQTSNKDLYRFDLICRIKDVNQKTFWSILERYFNSKYVVFEFKNHSKQITQKEIYTTEKYLYSKALRSVAIIISANGCEENAKWAAKGCLRESGKLIILFETEDLIKMNRMKIDYEDPSTHLLDKLDELLLKLEK